MQIWFLVCPASVPFVVQQSYANGCTEIACRNELVTCATYDNLIERHGALRPAFTLQQFTGDQSLYRPVYVHVLHALFVVAG